MSEKQRTIAILFADIAGSTPLYEAVGDVEAHRRVTESLGFMAQAIYNEGGRVLRTVGDATLASFESCDAALRAACSMQLLHEDTPLGVRCGFHYGTVIPDKGDVYGQAVNLAARVSSIARSGEITTTNHTIEHLSDANKELASYIDQIPVKGLSESVSVYRIAWESDRDLQTLIASRLAVGKAVKVLHEATVQQGLNVYRVTETNPQISIGRDNDCDIISIGERASRTHASLTWVMGQIEFNDASTNGSYIAREGQRALFVRRETVVLQGEGLIGLGDMPDKLADSAIRFKIYTTNNASEA